MASSIIIILVFFKIALAIQINYFSPALKLSPPSEIYVISPSLLLTNLLRQHYFIVDNIS